MKKLTPYIVEGLVAGVLVYYASTRIDTSTTTPAQVSELPTPEPTAPAPLEPLPTPKGTVSYHTLATTSPKPAAELANDVGLSHVDFTLSLNRLDQAHIPQGTTFVVPDSFADLDAYSPFPETIENANDIPKLFIISQRVQAFGAYEYGKRVHWGTVSTGKESTQTPSRLYSTNWKGKLVHSTIEDAWLLPWYFNLDSMEGISMHQYDLPGYPASHSCIRMSGKDAEWVYNWADQWVLSPDGNTRLAYGTPVIIYGQYAYGKTAPWKKLAQDPTATSLGESELADIVSQYHREILERQTQRQQILGEQ